MDTVPSPAGGELTHREVEQDSTLVLQDEGGWSLVSDLRPGIELTVCHVTPAAQGARSLALRGSPAAPPGFLLRRQPWVPPS